jgi:hypothetical protein
MTAIYTHRIDTDRGVPSSGASKLRSTFSVSGVLPMEFYSSERISNSFPEVWRRSPGRRSFCFNPNGTWMSCSDVKKCLVVLLLVMAST